METKTNIYIDTESLVRIAQDSSISPGYYRNIIEIFRRHANLFIDKSEEEIEEYKNPSDLNDVGDLFNFIEEANSLEWPKSALSTFTEIASDMSNYENYPNSIFILDSPIDYAKKIRGNYGVWVVSIQEMQDNIFFLDHGDVFNMRKYEGKHTNGWDNVFEEVPQLPPSNSIVITDSNLLSNNYVDREDQTLRFHGLENVKSILSHILPLECSISFYILVICPPCNNPNYIEAVKDWVNEVKGLRDYTLVVEFLTTSKTLHPRELFSNYYRMRLDRGFYVFKANSNIVNINGPSFNDFTISTYLHSPFGSGKSLLTRTNRELNSLKDIYGYMLRNTGETIMHEPKVKESEMSKNRVIF